MIRHNGTKQTIYITVKIDKKSKIFRQLHNQVSNKSLKLKQRLVHGAASVGLRSSKRASGRHHRADERGWR